MMHGTNKIGVRLSLSVEKQGNNLRKSKSMCAKRTKPFQKQNQKERDPMSALLAMS
jgi:hypothetical protein